MSHSIRDLVFLSQNFRNSKKKNILPKFHQSAYFRTNRSVKCYQEKFHHRKNAHEIIKTAVQITVNVILLASSRLLQHRMLSSQFPRQEEERPPFPYRSRTEHFFIGVILQFLPACHNLTWPSLSVVFHRCATQVRPLYAQ